MPATATDVTDGAVQTSRSRRHLLVPLGLSALFLALQTAVSTHGGLDPEATGRFWLVIGCLLLVAVHRWRSRVARGVVVVSAFVGVVMYGSAAFAEPHAVLVAMSSLGQALPLLTESVGQHVQPRG